MHRSSGVGSLYKNGKTENGDYRKNYVAECLHYRKREETPNDPKLSEPRGWRDRCVAGGERGGPEAAGVTAARVRCSELGVAVIWSWA